MEAAAVVVGCLLWRVVRLPLSYDAAAISLVVELELVEVVMEVMAL